MAKYKIKTHSGAKRRFSITGSGKLRRRKIGISHNRRKKSNAVLRQVSEMLPVEGRLAKRVKRLLPYGVK